VIFTPPSSPFEIAEILVSWFGMIFDIYELHKESHPDFIHLNLESQHDINKDLTPKADQGQPLTKEVAR
jgi:hypothetical protein